MYKRLPLKAGRVGFSGLRHWSHLGDSLAAVGLIAFTLVTLLVADLGLNWRELTTRRA